MSERDKRRPAHRVVAELLADDPKKGMKVAEILYSDDPSKAKQGAYIPINDMGTFVAVVDDARIQLEEQEEKELAERAKSLRTQLEKRASDLIDQEQ